MMNKCNLLYSIFSDDIVFSEKRRINAVMGYRVEEKLNIGGRDDMIKWLTNVGSGVKAIPEDKLWFFTNPVTGEGWYVGSNMLSYKRYPRADIRIIALYSDDRVLVDSLETLFKYRKLFGSACRILVNGNIGYLSTPHDTRYNSTPYTDEVILPYVI